MQDTEQFLKTSAERYEQEISRDYFIYHAFQYEFCRNAENSKQFVVIESWLAQQQDDSTLDFPAALRTMYAWYEQNYPTLCEPQPLTFARFYFFLPACFSFLHETQALWEKLHGTPPPAYNAEHDFWRELLAVVRDKCPHAPLLEAWLRWRYSERQAPAIAAENLPPNPFVERRTFGARRGSERRERGTRREGTARRTGARGAESMPRRQDSRGRRTGGEERSEAGRRRGTGDARRGRGREGNARREGVLARPRSTERMPRRGATSRHDDRGRERTGNRRFPSRESFDSRAVAELTDAMTSEIREAVAIMQDDNGHPGVTLKPANSYYRRLQHKMVANLGFTSISVGDDRENRAVKIVREA